MTRPWVRLWARWVVSWARCGGKPGMRKIDSCTGRNDMWGHPKSEKPTRTCPFHVRSKCAARRSCRTSGNARTRHSGWEMPKRKNVCRRHDTARGAVVSHLQGNPLHCSSGSGEDCHCDRPDKAIYLPLENLNREYVSARRICKFHLVNVASQHTVSRIETRSGKWLIPIQFMPGCT